MAHGRIQETWLFYNAKPSFLNIFRFNLERILKGLDCLLFGSWHSMGVTHRHFYIGMSGKFFDFKKRNPLHRQPRAERMPQGMKADPLPPVVNAFVEKLVNNPIISI
jgi:hypothetical protein